MKGSADSIIFRGQLPSELEKKKIFILLFYKKKKKKVIIGQLCPQYYL